MTTYVILQQQTRADGEIIGWVEISRVEARSDISAIRAGTIALSNQDDLFVAVPARSWRPRTVKAEQTTRLTIT